MPRHHLFAATLGLGLIAGFLQPWKPSRRGEVDSLGSPTSVLTSIEPLESKRNEMAVAVPQGEIGKSNCSAESKTGNPESHHKVDTGMNLAAMAEALRSAPDAGQKGEWADRIAAVGGREAVEHLMTLATEEQNEEALRAILEGFKGLSDSQDILLLASAVTATSDFRILEAAIEMISRSGTSEVVNYLAELSRQDPLQPTQRFAALWTIERIQNPEALRGLAKLVQQAPEPDLARAAAVALSRIGGPLAESVLTESAVDRHPNNPDFQQLVQHGTEDQPRNTDPARSLASWASITEGSTP